MQIITIIGHLGQDAEQINVTGRTKIRCSVAVNHRKDEPPKWYTIFTHQQNLQQFLTKGSKVCVSGRFTPDIYTDRQGVARLGLTISASHIELLGSPTTHQAEPDGPVEGGGGGGGELFPSEAPKNNAYRV